MKPDLSERFVVEEHWRHFHDFAHWERAVGGPDPQLDTLAAMVEDWELVDRAWACGLFAAAYCLGPAEAIWREFTPEQVVADEPRWTAWVAANWQGLPLRRERRAVRTPGKFARCVASYAKWLLDCDPSAGWFVQQDYEAGFAETAQVWGMGRYIQMKLMEALHRCGVVVTRQDQLMAKGGWSPRTGLASLYPEDASWLTGGDDAATCARVEARAAELLEVLAAQGLELSWFHLQVFLCEYKQALRGKKYPGRSHDSELEYWRRSQAHFGGESGLLPARQRAFPAEVLGESSGMWMGVREDCERTLIDHGYMWTDLLYDYTATTDFARPKVRDEVEA